MNYELIGFEYVYNAIGVGDTAGSTHLRCFKHESLITLVGIQVMSKTHEKNIESFPPEFFLKA